MDNKRIVLVTGGLGYIGSHTVVELHKAGYEVVIIDNLCNSEISVLKSITRITGRQAPVHFYVGDICTESNSNIDYIFGRYKITDVIHFAAHKSVPESVHEPMKYYKNNVSGLIALLNKMYKHKVRNIIFSSSCTVYGQPDELPVDELTPLKEPSNTYGMTKKMCEDIIIDLSNRKQISSTILRYFNPIGCHSSGLLADQPKGEPENLIPNIVEVLNGNKEQLKVYGTDYKTPDGTTIRDYIDVNDLARAHVYALKNSEPGYTIFNVGSGKGLSVLEILKSFEKLGYEIPHSLEDKRPGDIEKIYADASKMDYLLGWKSQISLEETIKSIINYLEINLKK